MKLCEAEAIAKRIKGILAPHCDRIEIAGSIRRMKPNPGDIEIVCIPKTISIPSLFGTADIQTHSYGFIEACAMLGERLKGDPNNGKYIQFLLPEGIKLDLFIATPDNWGLIFAIRTGSADFSHHVLATGWVRAGYKSQNGMLFKNNKIVLVREESDLFKLIGIPFVDPQERI